MNLTSTLKDTWTEISASVQKSETANVSLMAFQLGKAIEKNHPDLGFSFNAHYFQSNSAKPNIVIWHKTGDKRVLFFGTLVFESEERPSPASIVQHAVKIIEGNSFDVLINSSADNSTQYETMPLSKNFEFGLFFASGPGKTGYKFRSLWGPMTPDQLSRFHFAQIEAETPGSQRLISFYRSPPENHEKRRGDGIPDLSFKLDDGRVVYVNSLIWEPSYSEKFLIPQGCEQKVIVAEQKRMKAEQFFGNQEVLYIEADYADADPPRLPNTAITAWLSSAPIQDSAIRSELIVIFLVEYSKNGSLEAMLQSSLSDIIWEAHATDVSHKNIGLWKDNWLINR